MHISGFYEVINDKSNFWKLSSHTTIEREGKLPRFWLTSNNKVFFSKEQYGNICPNGSQPVRLHDNPKMHKLKSESDKLTFRHIVSSIGA